GAVRVLGADRTSAALVAEPGDSRSGADVDGPGASRPADGAAADQDPGDRAGARAGLAERPAPYAAAGPAGRLAPGPDSADRVAGRTADRSQRTPRGAGLNASAEPGERPGRADPPATRIHLDAQLQPGPAVAARQTRRRRAIVRPDFYHWGVIRLGADLWPVAGSYLTAGGVRPVGAAPWTPAAVADAVSGE